MYSPISLKIKNIISFEGEHEFKFRNGQAIIVTGINHDNTSQKVNGSGKSALIEAIALALFGTSIRDVKVKELINRRSKEGEVELELFNSKLKHTLTIWWRIHSGTKAAECKLWIDETELKLSDINEYKKKILELIGLTKEDILNFYLLTQANYSPFLRVGDTKKKEIINRFSGADDVDNLTPLVQADLKLFDPEFETVNAAIQSNTAKMELIDRQIEDLKEQQSTWDSDKEELINEINIEIKKWTDWMKERWEKAFPHIDVAREVKAKLLANNYDKRIELLEAKKQDIVLRKNDTVEQSKELKDSLQNVKHGEQFKNRLLKINERETQLKTAIKENKEVLKEYEEYKADLEKQLLESITCPKCTHEFSVKNEDFDPAVAKEQLPVIEQEIATIQEANKVYQAEIDVDLEEQWDQLKDDIAAAEEKLRDEIVKIDNHLNKLNKIITHCTNFSKRLLFSSQEEKRTISSSVQQAMNERAKVHQSLIKLAGFNAQIETYNAKDFDAEIKAKEGEKEEYIKNLQENQREFDQLTLDRQVIAEWETNFKNFKSYIANQSIKNIEDYTNLFLEQMKSDLGIKLDGYTTLASKKIREQISTMVLRGGFEEGSYGAYSGGERGRIDVCVIIAIQQLINLNCPSGGLDLLICDEILDQIDALGLESIINALQNLDRTIMIVSQNEINTLKEYTLVIEKRNKVSTFAV